MSFKSGHEDITYIKSDAAFKRSGADSTDTIVLSGIRGLISMELGAALANGAELDFTFENSFIKSDSVINLCVCKKDQSVSYIPMTLIPCSVEDNTCLIRVINEVGIELASDKIIYIAYEVVN